jgi:hypothetical protein
MDHLMMMSDNVHLMYQESTAGALCTTWANNLVAVGNERAEVFQLTDTLGY